jgi:hypothetical protein
MLKAKTEFLQLEMKKQQVEHDYYQLQNIKLGLELSKADTNAVESIIKKLKSKLQ